MGASLLGERWFSAHSTASMEVYTLLEVCQEQTGKLCLCVGPVLAGVECRGTLIRAEVELL